jgi:hypothetical protein
LARRDVSFVYLAGGQRPDYRTLARFRRRNVKEIRRLFKESVKMCARLGLVNLGHIALDGTKLKANTIRGKHKGERVIRIEKDVVEFGRIYQCCWGHTTNCSRTRIGGCSDALDRWAAGHS